MTHTVEPAIERLLGPAEDMYWRFDSVSPLNFGVVAQISGPMNEIHLQWHSQP